MGYEWTQNACRACARLLLWPTRRQLVENYADPDERPICFPCWQKGEN